MALLCFSFLTFWFISEATVLTSAHLVFPLQTSFLLLITVVPPLMALLCFRIIRAIPPTESEAEQENEHANFLIVYPIGFSLAAFLLITILSREFFRISHAWNVAITTTMVLILASMLIVPIKEYWGGKASRKSTEQEVPGQVGDLESVPLVGTLGAQAEADSQLRHHPRASHEDGRNWLDVESRAESIAYGLRTEAGDKALLAFRDSQERMTNGARTRRRHHLADALDLEQEVTAGNRGAEETWGQSRGTREEDTEDSDIDEEVAQRRRDAERGCYSVPKIGTDHGVLESFATLDFWVLFLSTMCGAGSGLTAINK
jgi:hypothetical protein